MLIFNTKKKFLFHNPVLLNEIIHYIQLKNNGRYLDCTFGSGGYSSLFLKLKYCFVTALDKDSTVKVFADNIKSQFNSQFNFIQCNFADIKYILKNQKFHGIIFDFGMSSMQLNSPNRGFSFMLDGPLDMRMNQNEGISAKEFLSLASEEKIANIIFKYGEEPQSRQIANAIVKARMSQNINTTFQLSKIIRDAMHYRKSKINLVTKTFQAIRIYINRELESIEKILSYIKDFLYPGGRILAISFHSLEDSLIKNFFKKHSAPKIAISKYAKHTITPQKKHWLKVITKKPIISSNQEIALNIRSRSAKLRVAEYNDI